MTLMRPSPQTGAPSLLAAAAFVAAGCSNSPAATVPLGAPSIQIAELLPSGGPGWTPGSKQCVELGRDPAETIGVKVTLDNWTLRPPNACGGTPQCGYVRLLVDPEGDAGAFETIAASQLVPASMSKLAHPLGQHTFRVELLTDTGEAVLDTQHAPIADQVSVTVGATGQCGAPGDGGLDAPSDASADAPADATADAPAEGASDAPNDAVSDSPSDASSDAPSDGAGEADAGTTDGGAD